MKINRMLRLVLMVFAMFSISAGCGGGGTKATQSLEAPPDEGQNTAQAEETGETAPEETGETSHLLSIKAPDPCSLVSKEQAESALGKSVGDAVVAEDEVQKSCTYIAVPGESFVTVDVFKEAGAKSFLLSDISGLQDECSPIWLNTWAGEPTLSPEVETLRSGTVLDLFIKDLELQEGCGLSYEQLNDLGENAYHFMPFFGVLIGVATDDTLATFFLTDPSMSPETQMSADKELVRSALSE
jgi:hypothetical protein